MVSVYSTHRWLLGGCIILCSNIFGFAQLCVCILFTKATNQNELFWQVSIYCAQCYSSIQEYPSFDVIPESKVTQMLPDYIHCKHLVDLYTHCYTVLSYTLYILGQYTVHTCLYTYYKVVHCVCLVIHCKNILCCTWCCMHPFCITSDIKCVFFVAWGCVIYIIHHNIFSN